MPNAIHCILVDRTDGLSIEGTYGLGNTLLPESALSLLRRALSTSNAGEEWQQSWSSQAWCRACGRRIALSYGTAYFDLHADPALVELAIRALAEGNSIRSTARIVQIDKDTVCSWLSRAAHQC
jgi:transposase-like protein